MKEQLISFKTAVLAKEKGFNEPVQEYYSDQLNGELGYRVSGESTEDRNFNTESLSYSAPTQSLLQKWLREKHKIHIGIDALGQCNYHLKCGIIGRIVSINNGYRTYEKALEQGLYEALKLIK